MGYEKPRTMTEPQRVFFARLNLVLAVLVTLLCVGESYVILNSVSWAVTSEVEEEIDASSNEDAAPALLEDTGSIWKQSYPAAVYKEDAERRGAPRTASAKQLSSPSRMFSYRREGLKATDSAAPPPHEEAERTARYLAHHSSWGFLATISTQQKIQGLPFGNIFSVSDGPLDNGTGTPYFYVTAMDNSVVDLRSNPAASLTLSEAESEYCRDNLIDPQDPRCARLTLTGRMVAVEVKEVDFAKEALFSR
ncbi:protein CREG2 isoform X2 [Amia ocellicauda]